MTNPSPGVIPAPGNAGCPQHVLPCTAFPSASTESAGLVLSGFEK